MTSGEPPPDCAICERLVSFRLANRKANPDCIDEQVEIEEERFARAPVVIAIVSRTIPEHKIPEWEQVLSAGAVCMNLLNAAHAAGYSAQWLTDWCAFDDEAGRVLGLADGERFAGFIHIGTALEPPVERPRPDLDTIVSDWTDR